MTMTTYVLIKQREKGDREEKEETERDTERERD